MCTLSESRQACRTSVLTSVLQMEEMVDAEAGKESNLDPSSTLEMVDKWGPSVRTIIDLANGHTTPLSLEGHAKTAARIICTNPIPTLSYHGSIPSSLVFVRPYRQYKENDDIESSDACKYFIPTTFPAELVETSRAKISNDASLELYENISMHSLTKSAAGWAHEIRVHHHLCGAKGALTIFRDDLTTQNMVPSSHLLAGTVSGLKHSGALESFYWIPSVIDFPGIDGVLGDIKGNIYAVQATIAGEHKSPVDGLRKI
ncbi:uncharacterized protein STEHIDRAFT_155243 [Stereum hirsutum FP-91666 SS1]|uniref:uncharacterized protein n=1 Tax=Stereum hirsutum (strain FP-91666) TaxID=721885 RepID=UPI0004410057|nr:uncharacterized protein STEHIDRAFT_155243 [Stereum hirsutum FP-91666 SS1]EIM87880.1 hypothetical protein STEHIDRAFT_155243 [Stereum hirsutum FP-91666 SS1]